MHTRFFWDSPPAADFNNHISWTQLDKHRFAATRIRIVCVQTETAYGFHGPEPDTAAINSASAARKFTYKREPIVTRSTTISDTICKAVRDRVLNHITSRKRSTGINAPLPLGKVQLSSELIVDEVHEVTRTSEDTLSQVTSYSFQRTEGESVEINVGFKDGLTIAELRRRYNKCPRTFMFIPVTTSNWNTIQDGSGGKLSAAFRRPRRHRSARHWVESSSMSRRFILT